MTIEENLTPQYRIEEYLEAIVSGWADATEVAYPEVPSWRIEEFLDAFITYIWEDGDHPRHPCPEPVWRIEECLRAIYDVMTGAATPWAFPLPATTRIEEYLAAIHAYLTDGTELPVPEPVWRIEQWLAYALDAVKQGGDVTKTVSGTMVHITDALAKAALSVLVDIDPVQAGSGDPSPENVRPITGWTGAKVTRTGINVWDEEWEVGSITDTNGGNVEYNDRIRSKNYIAVKPSTSYYFYVGVLVNFRIFKYRNDKSFIGYEDVYPNTVYTTDENTYYIRFRMFVAYGTTYNHDISINYPSTDTAYHPGHVQTYSITFPTEAGTVYGGTLDVTNGVLTVDMAMVDLGTPTWIKDTNRAGNFYTGNIELDVNPKGFAVICSNYAVNNAANPNTITNGELSSLNSYGEPRVFVKDLAKADFSDSAFKAAMSGVQLVCALATPITYQLTPQEVQMLLGENNVWASSGDTVSVTYYAEGNANTLQSLNILLGGNYSNPKTADDVSDKEALEIILGGNK